MTDQKEKWLNRADAANFLGVKKESLAVWASSNRYKLTYYKCGSRLVKYKLSDLNKFLENNCAINLTKKND